MRKCLAIVLAAGEGKRMRSSRPKVLHQVAGRSMLAHVLDAVAQAGADELAVVVGPGRDDVAAEALRASLPCQGLCPERATRHRPRRARGARGCCEGL